MSARKMNSAKELFQITEKTHSHSSAHKFFGPTYLEKKTSARIYWLGHKALG